MKNHLLPLFLYQIIIFKIVIRIKSNIKLLLKQTEIESEIF